VNEGEARRRFADARVGRLATVRPNGTPHVVPFVFALAAHAGSDRVYWAVDDKPKSSERMARLANIASNPSVEAVADRYEEDWGRLWWVRATGTASVVTDHDERARALELLAAKYARYRETAPIREVVRIEVERWTWWEGRPGPDGP
jgi:PPOX class probable F420-dependent enzyme